MNPPIPNRHRRSTLALSLIAAATLSACASLQTGLDGQKLKAPPPAAPVQQIAVPAWSAPLPHGGQAAALGQWWAQFQDPQLTSLIDKAQALSPSLAQAQARIAQSQAALAQARGNLLPSAGAQISGLRSATGGAAPATVLQGGVQASWELDLFGKNAGAVDGAVAEVQGAQASWHEARVSLAAEVGRNYLGMRLCEQQAGLLGADLKSREETQRLSTAAVRAGILAPANLALGNASLAEAESRLNAQNLACAGLANALTALTAVPAAELLKKQPSVQAFTGLDALKFEAVPALAIPSIPAQALAQRPDVYRAERDVVVAAAAVLGADAAMKPSISIGGTLGATRTSAGGFTQSGPTWSLGPISFTFPLLATQAMKAQSEASRVAYQATEVAYRATIRQAVREVDDALGTLASVAERNELNKAAARGYRSHFAATEAKHRAGLASLVELEDARRIALAADNTVLALAQERVGAWINLYRALGGGWTTGDNATAPSLTAPPNAVLPAAAKP